MFNTLSQFYNSKEWKSFRENLIFERTNKDNGVLYCEYSKKPLINKFDIVLHHKQPLTSANVNDYDISLNPKNILIVSQQAHNEIHSRFGHSTEKKVFVVAGAPCSGKSTFIDKIKGNSDLIVDIDLIWHSLTGKMYYKPNALKTPLFAIRDKLYEIVRTRAGNWEKAYITTTERSQGALDRLVDRLGAELIEIDTPKEDCLKRLYKAPNGRNIKLWEQYIANYFD